MVAELDPGQAWEMLQKEPAAVLLDVRSRAEYELVGHPVGAVHVALQEYPDWRPDLDFVAHVAGRLRTLRPGTAPEDVPIVAMCRSGKRSEAAAAALAAAGYRRVYNMREGFEGDRDQDRHRNTLNGWRQRGLPWEQT